MKRLRKRYGRAITSWKRIVAEREKRLTDHDIESLKQAAGQAGDLKQVRICDRALAGSRKARLICSDVIADWESRT